MKRIIKLSCKLAAVLAVCAGVSLVTVDRAQAHGWFGFNFGFYDPGSGVSVSIGGPAFYAPAPVYPVVAPPPYGIYPPAVVVPQVIVPVYRPAYRYPYGYRYAPRVYRRWDDD